MAAKAKKPQGQYFSIFKYIRGKYYKHPAWKLREKYRGINNFKTLRVKYFSLEFEIIVSNLWNIPKVYCIASQISCDFLIVEVVYRKTKVFNIFADQGND